MISKGEQTRQRILDTAEELVMSKGFAGTSIDDILKKAGLTKGAFFHHFKGKAEMARELVERHSLNDLGMFEEFIKVAEANSDDPLAQMIQFLEMFEHKISSEEDPSPGCMYAVYTYESTQFDPGVQDFVADTLRRWTSIYVRKFQEVDVSLTRRQSEQLRNYFFLLFGAPRTSPDKKSEDQPELATGTVS
jgi:TetR/AcrR family transcriptional repressor of nem operon